MLRDVLGVLAANALVYVTFRLAGRFGRISKRGYGGFMLILLPLALPMLVPRYSVVPPLALFLFATAGLCLVMHSVGRREARKAPVNDAAEAVGR